MTINTQNLNMNNNGGMTTDVRPNSLEIPSYELEEIKSDKVLTLKVKEQKFVISWGSDDKDLNFDMYGGGNKHNILFGVTQYSNQVTEWLWSERRFKKYRTDCSGENSWLVLGGVWLEVIIQDGIIHGIRVPKERLYETTKKTTKKKTTKKKTTKKKKTKKIEVNHTRDVVEKVNVWGTKKITCEVSTSHSAKLIYGRTQSGKTRKTTRTLLQRMQVDKCCGLFLTRNYNTELKTQVGTLQGYADKFRTGMEVIPVYADNPKWDKVVESMRMRDSTKLYVLMGNSSSLTKMFNLMKNSDRLRYTVAIDEADIYCKTKTGISKLVKLLCDGAIAKYFISATILDCSLLINAGDKVEAIPTKFAYEDRVDGEKVFYRSYRNSRYHHLPNENNTAKAAYENGVKIMKLVEENKVYIHFDKAKIPYMFLHFHSESNAKNGHLAGEFSKCELAGRKVYGLTFDSSGGSGGCKASLYSGGCVVKTTDGLGEMITYLMKTPKSVIYMMGGKLVSRAFRVTCSNYRAMVSCLIYNYKNYGDASVMTQRFGRMNGLSPLELGWCTQEIFSSLNNYHRVLDTVEWTSGFVRTAEKNPTKVFSKMKTMVVVPVRTSTKALSKGGLEKLFTKSKKVENIHSRIPDEQGETTPPPPPTNDEQGHEDETTPPPPPPTDDDPVEGLEAVAAAYEKNGLVRKIIDAFIAADFASLSKTELDKVCGKKLCINDFNHWDLTPRRARYKIIQLTPTGNYNLRSNIITHLNLF